MTEEVREAVKGVFEWQGAEAEVEVEFATDAELSSEIEVQVNVMVRVGRSAANVCFDAARLRLAVSITADRVANAEVCTSAHVNVGARRNAGIAVGTVVAIPIVDAAICIGCCFRAGVDV